MARFPRKISLLLFAVLAFSLVNTALTADPPQTGSYHDLAIPLTPPTPTVTAVQAQIQELLARYTATKPRPVTQLTRGRQAILYGNLFRTGENYALVEIILPPTPPDEWSTELTALALRQNGRWQLRGLWNIPPTWRPPGRKPDSEDPLLFTPATSAFNLVDLSDARSREVVVAGEVDRYFQSFYLLRFSPADKTLHIVTTSMAPPERLGPYVRLYDQSPRRAIWGEWTYCGWKGSTLIDVASWHDETPYYESEGPPFIEVKVFASSGRPQTFRITDPEFNDLNQTIYRITRDGQPYAYATFIPNSKHPRVPYEERYLAQQAWLFHKLTTLPREFFPLPDDTSGKSLSPAEIKDLIGFKRLGRVQWISAHPSSSSLLKTLPAAAQKTNP